MSVILVFLQFYRLQPLLHSLQAVLFIVLGRVLMQQPAIQRLPLIAYEQKRTAYFTMGRQRMGKRKGRKPQVIDHTEPLIPSVLYENEISKEVFEAREKDLVSFTT